MQSLSAICWGAVFDLSFYLEGWVCKENVQRNISFLLSENKTIFIKYIWVSTANSVLNFEHDILFSKCPSGMTFTRLCGYPRPQLDLNNLHPCVTDRSITLLVSTFFHMRPKVSLKKPTLVSSEGGCGFCGGSWLVGPRPSAGAYPIFVKILET